MENLPLLHSICLQIWKTQQWPQDWKKSVFIPIPKKGTAKECSNYHTIALISHASKVMLKILQTRLQQYVNRELPDVQAGFRKGRGTRDQIANICWIIKKAREFQKNIYFCFIDYARRWWWTGRPGVLQFMGSQSNLVTELNWIPFLTIVLYLNAPFHKEKKLSTNTLKNKICWYLAQSLKET